MTKDKNFKDESQDARRHDQQKEVHPKDKKLNHHELRKDHHSGTGKQK